jgi:hypothetical protein
MIGHSFSELHKKKVKMYFFKLSIEPWFESRLLFLHKCLHMFI